MPAPVSPLPSIVATAAAAAAERLVAAADAARLGMFDLDVGARSILASAGLLQLVGVAADAPPAVEAWLARVHPDDRATLPVALDRALRDDGVFAVACRVRHEDGDWRWLEARGRAVRDAGGRVRVAGVATDVTSVRREEQALREGEARFREAFEHAPIGMALTDPGTGRLLHVNRAYADIVGYDVEELARLDFLTLTHPDDRARNSEVFGQMKRGEIPAFVIEKRYLHKDGHPVWVRATGVMQYDGHGRPYRVIGLVEDVDDRHRAQAARLASEAQLRQLVEQAPALMFVADARGTQQFVNARWREYTGVDFADRAAWDSVVHPDDRDGSWREWRRALETGSRFEYEMRLREGATGDYRWFVSQGLPLRDEGGRIVRWFGLLTDIHERRLATERAEALQRITAALASATTRADVGQVVATMGARFMDAASGGLAVTVNGAGGEPPAIEFVELGPGDYAWQRLPLDAELPVALAIRDGSPFLFSSRAALVARFPAAEAWLAARPQVDATATMPVRVRDAVAGAVVFAYPGGRPVDAEGAARLDAVARLVGTALERVQLLDALRRELAEREQAVREFRTLAETVPDIVFTCLPDGTLDWYNSRTVEFTGRPWGADSGEAWRADVHPDDLPGVTESWRRALAAGTPYENEARWRRAHDGAWRWMLNRAVPLRDGTGAIRRWVGTSTDIHEQRRAAERVATLQRVTAALGSALDTEDVARVTVLEGLTALGATFGGLWLLDEERAVLRRVWQIAASEDARREFLEIPLTAPTMTNEAVRARALVWAEDPATIRARYPALARMVDEGLRSAAALPLTVDGRVMGVLAIGFPTSRQFAPDERALFDALARQCALAMERTRLYDAERAAREEAERARVEAEQARSAAEEARAAAEAASRAKSEFLAVMSHELRTPLNAIAGHVELLEMGIHGPLQPPQREALERVTRAQRHLLALINDVLNLSRIESGRIEYELEEIDVAELVASVAPLIEPQLASRQLAYDVHLPATLLVRADRDKLRQVLLNLLANAVKYTEPGGRVSVDAWTRPGAGPFGFVRVRDTGCGIAREKLEAIFEPFVRVDTRHTRRTDGAGLGLAIARDLARGMGGELRARSAVGEGSSFTVALPLA